MPLFRYTARNAHTVVSGSLQAVDSATVAAHLLSQSLEPLTIEAQAAAPLSWPLRHLFAGESLLSEETILFARQLAALIKAGVAIIHSLQTIREHSRHPLLQQALNSVIDSLHAGGDLASACADHPQIFGRLIPRLLRVGEQTGRLDSALLQIHAYLLMERDWRRRLRAALRYPALVLLTALLTLLVVNAFVIPSFAKLFARFAADLPMVTRLLIGSSQLIEQHWLLLIGLLSALLFLLPALLHSPWLRHWWDRQKLRLPLAGPLIHKSLLARLAHTFAMAYHSGLTVAQTLDILEETLDNQFMVRQLAVMRHSVQQGDSLTEAAHRSGLFPPMVLQMVAVGEQSGQLGDLLQEVARYYDREVEYEMQAMTTLLEPLLIAIVAVVVLILALGIFLPLWNLGSVALGRR
ncbi:MAG: type II secretion system F family protein [Magnetococcales bacterium]|nr:type II secretion system F family protein [Magnetococcales bacterium]